MIWLLLIPVLLALGSVLSHFAWKSLHKVESSTTEPCAHPWYIDGRCMVCGTPK